MIVGMMVTGAAASIWALSSQIEERHTAPTRWIPSMLVGHSPFFFFLFSEICFFVFLLISVA